MRKKRLPNADLIKELSRFARLRRGGPRPGEGETFESFSRRQGWERSFDLDSFWGAMSPDPFPGLRRVGLVHEPIEFVDGWKPHALVADMRNVCLCPRPTNRGQMASLDLLAGLHFPDGFGFAAYVFLTLLETLSRELDRTGLIRNIAWDDRIYACQLRDLLAAYFSADWHHACRDVTLPELTIALSSLDGGALLANECSLLAQIALLSSHIWLERYALAHFVRPDGTSWRGGLELKELYRPRGKLVDGGEIMPLGPKLNLVR